MDSATITVDVVNGAQLDAGVTSGAIVLVDVIYGQSITADVVTGARGNDGAPGPAGAGVPNGGTTGQVLQKASNADQDTEWATPSGGPGGGVSSVNGESGTVILTTDDISDSGQVNKWATAAEKVKLGFIAITQAVDLDALEAASHTHANQATLDATTAIFTTAKDMKLSGVATGATANDTDANLKNRANHTGTQTASTISDFTAAAQTAAPAETETTVGGLISGATAKTTPVDADSVGISDSAASGILKKLTFTNLKAFLKTYFDTLYAAITHTHAQSDVTGLVSSLSGKEPTITAGTSSQYYRGDKTMQTLNQDAVPDGTTNKAYTATEKTKLGGIAVGATANSSDATLLARVNHTGTQLASTISDFNSAADARIAAASVDALADVAVSAPSSGQVLKWNGSAWTNQADATGGGGLSDADYGDVVVSGGATVFSVESAAGAFAFKGVASPAQFTVDQNDFNPTTNSVIRVSGDSDNRTVTSISGGASGRILYIENVGATDIILRNDDGATGTAANRFDFGGSDVILEPREIRALIYDATLSRWVKCNYEYDYANLRRQPMYFWDYHLAGVATANFPNTAVSAGTMAFVNTDNDHPGYMTITSSTTANSGAQSFLYGSQTLFHIMGGEVYECVFQPKVASNTATTMRFGFLDTITSTDAVDGAYFELPAGSFAIVGKTSNNSTRTTSATIATLAVNTWYRARIRVNRAASSVTFEIYDANGVLLGSQTNSANIPTASGREFGAGFIATNSGTTATLLAWLDYQSVQIGASKPLLR